MERQLQRIFVRLNGATPTSDDARRIENEVILAANNLKDEMRELQVKLDDVESKIQYIK